MSFHSSDITSKTYIKRGSSASKVNIKSLTKVKKPRRKKYGKRKHSNTSLLSSETSRFCDPEFEIDGAILIELSRPTRLAIGCIIGEDFNLEEPWLFVLKEKILVNLEFHEKSSEFLSISQDIIDYPHDEMLIGYNNSLDDDKQEFILCIKVSAKRKIFQILQQRKSDLEEKLKESILKTPQPWFSYGSEEEVDDNIIRNMRSLIEIEIDFTYPLVTDNYKFRMRKVEHVLDGYVELLPRIPCEIVERRKIDASVQATSTHRDNETQVICTNTNTMWTQYDYVYEPPKLTAKQIKYLEEFINEKAHSICDYLFVNNEINIYVDDYKKISKPVPNFYDESHQDIVSFQNVLLCNRKLITDLEMSPFISGLYAVSYGQYTKNSFLSESSDYVDKIIFGTQLVLIWCTTQQNKPKLILKSDREIQCLRYCPFRKDILLGGCSNGQIVLWDLKGKLEEVEKIEIITQQELQHRIILQNMIRWMKKPEGIEVVRPTVTSNIQYSHGDTVIQIDWILPNYKFDKNGMFTRLDQCDSLQVMTYGLNGTILIWDLHETFKQKRARKFSSRLKEPPKGLLKNISEFKHLNHLWVPIFKIYMNIHETDFPVPLSQIVTNNFIHEFEAIEPDPTNNIFIRTYYERKPLNPTYEITNTFSAVDKLGKVYQCYFEGNEFDQGLVINQEKCKYVEYTLIHDGPILYCSINQLLKNVFITAGGHIFAIWDSKEPPKPLIWRKSPCRIIAGCFSVVVPWIVLIQRVDSYFEFWDFSIRTKTPTRIIHMRGSQILDIYNDPCRMHCRKNTLIVTDVTGSVRLFNILAPEKINLESEIKKIFELFCGRKHNRNEHYKKWLDQYKQKHFPADEETEEIIEDNQQVQEKKEESKKSSVTKVEQKVESKKPSKTKVEKKELKKSTISKEFKKNKCLEKETNEMIEAVLKKQHINLTEIEKNLPLVQKFNLERKQKQRKERLLLENKENIFNTETKKLFGKVEAYKTDKYKIQFPEDIIESMKEFYIESYNNILESTLTEIKNNPYDKICKMNALTEESKAQKSDRFSSKYSSRPSRTRSIIPEIIFKDGGD